jgi:hypothetical protein
MSDLDDASWGDDDEPGLDLEDDLLAEEEEDDDWDDEDDDA